MDVQVVVDSLTKIFTDIVSFIPRLVNGLVIVVVGYLIAHVVRVVLGAVLRRVRFDPLVERTGVTASLRGVGIRTPLSQIIAQVIFILLFISFLISATRLMGLEAVAVLLERLLNYLPNAIAALIVFLLGGIVARFVGDLVATVAAAEGLGYATRVGRIVQYLISLFVAVLALGVLGLDTALLVTAITIMIAAFGLALGLALGLGMRPVLFQILAGYYIRQRLDAGRRVELDQVTGEIGSVGSVNTLVTTDDGLVVVPNGRLFESMVRLPQGPVAVGPPTEPT